MKIAPIVLIGIGLTPLLIWLIAFGAICAVYRRRMKGIERDQQRQQLRRLLWRNVKAMTVVRMEFTRCFRIGHDWAEELGYAWHKTIVGVNADFQIDCMSFSEACRSMLQLEPNQILCLGRNLGGLRSALLNAIERKALEKFNKATVWSATTEYGQQATSPDGSCAIFTTFDGCKGMERDVCFVCDWTTSYLQTRLEKPNARRDILLNHLRAGR